MSYYLYTTQTPTTVGSGSYELGNRFRSTVAGDVLGIRIYIPAGEVGEGTHTVRLWQENGTPLESTTFVTEPVTSGWHYQEFDSPIAILANTDYRSTCNFYTKFNYNNVDDLPYANETLSSDIGCYSFTQGTFPDAGTNTLPYFLDPLFEPSAGTTPVGYSADARWTLRENIGKNVDARWGLAELVGAGANVRWALQQTVGQSADVRYALSELVGLSADVRWALEAALAAVGKSADVQWGLNVTVGAGADARWALNETVGQSADVRYALLESVRKSADARWALNETVGLSADAQWALISDLEAVGKSADARWALMQTVGQDADTRWELLESVGMSADVRYQLLDLAGKSADVRWALREAVGKSADVRWVNLEVVGQSADVRWALQMDGAIVPIHLMYVAAENRIMILDDPDRVTIVTDKCTTQ